MLIDNRIPALPESDGRTLTFRFAPRDAKRWPYVIQSDAPELNDQTGAFTAIMPPPERTSRASPRHPNWWIDDPAPAAREGVHDGAKHVSRWRKDFLDDFAARMRRVEKPAAAGANPPKK